MHRPPEMQRGALDGAPRGSDLAQEIDAAELNPSRPSCQAWAARRLAERFALSLAHAGAVVELAGIGRGR